MPTTQGNRPILDQKRWEWVTPAPAVSSAGACIGTALSAQPLALAVASSTVAYLYQPESDGWSLLPSPALAGVFGAGTAVCATGWSAGATASATSITATGGSATTITTSMTLARDLRGFKVHILSGPNAGATIDITRNTIGANSVITVPTQASAFTSSTVFRLLTPRWYVLNAGTLAAGSWKFYDFATNVWVTCNQTGLPGAISTDTGITATSSVSGGSYLSFATGTSSGSNTSTTINDGSKSWATNQWSNSQVRIVGGTGAGQIRSISSNSGTSLTVGAAWTVTPDATSTYSIEGNDDYLYLKTSGGGSLWRYSISGNATTTLASTTVSSAGFELHWVSSASDALWSSENAIINGRRIYAFRGAGGAVLDVYDIPTNTWATVSWAPGADTFTTGSSYIDDAGFIYVQKDTTGRWLRLNLVTNEMDGWTTMLYTQGTAVIGNRAWIHKYRDGATTITYIYFWLNSSSVVLRQMVI